MGCAIDLNKTLFFLFIAYGRNGVSLKSLWRGEFPDTLHGMSASGFPNMFFLLGPNTGLGHNSVVTMIEM